MYKNWFWSAFAHTFASLFSGRFRRTVNKVYVLLFKLVKGVTIFEAKTSLILIIYNFSMRYSGRTISKAYGARIAPVRVYTTINCRRNFNTPQYWIEKCRSLDLKLRQAYSRAGFIFFRPEIVQTLKNLIWMYNCTVTKFIRTYFHTKNTWTTANLPFLLQKMQRVFIESFSTRIYGIVFVRNSQGTAGGSGVDNLNFTSLSLHKNVFLQRTLTCTRYGKSAKGSKLKKKLPKKILAVKASTSFALAVALQNKKLAENLMQACKMHKVLKRYKVSSVKCTIGTKRLYAVTLRDRILQLIVQLAVKPMVICWNTYCSTKPISRSSVALSILAFGTGLRGYVAKKATQKLKRKVCFKLATELAKNIAHGFPQVSNYCGDSLDKKEGRRKLHTKPCFRFMRICISEFFETITHSFLIASIPLQQKYMFFLKSWLTAPIYYWQVKKGCYARVKKPKHGSFSRFSLNPIFYNLTLVGLQQHIWRQLALRWGRNWKLPCITASLIKRFSLSRKVCLRVTGYKNFLFVVGKFSEHQFEQIFANIYNFLQQRGIRRVLSIEKFSKSAVFTPKVKFNFLGFCFQFPSLRGQKQAKNIQDMRLKKKKISLAAALAPYLTATPKLLTRLKFALRKILTPKHIWWPVSKFLDRLQRFMTNVVLLYGCTQGVKYQLVTHLSHFIFVKLWRILLRKFSSVPKLRSYVRVRLKLACLSSLRTKNLVIPRCFRF